MVRTSSPPATPESTSRRLHDDVVFSESGAVVRAAGGSVREGGKPGYYSGGGLLQFSGKQQ